MHLCTKFGCNWSEPVRTGAIWKRLTEITITIWPQMTFDLVMWPLTLSCDLQVRHNVKVSIVHLWSKFGYNWSEPVRTGAIWKRLTETLTDERTDARTNGHTEFGSLCVSTNIRSGDTKSVYQNVDGLTHTQTDRQTDDHAGIRSFLADDLKIKEILFRNIWYTFKSSR